MHQETSEKLGTGDDSESITTESSNPSAPEPLSPSLILQAKPAQELELEIYQPAGEESLEQLPKNDCEEEEKVPAPLLLREPSTSDPVPPESQDQYYQFLKDFRLTTYNMWNSEHSKFSHHIGPRAEDFHDTFSNRINKEIKILARDLPCEKDGSIFLAFDEKRLDLLKALIMGPVDTPYAFGLYQFHIALPGNYPHAPPVVKITTTGNGSVRFNPNLYEDGYVCLSIINTWEGSPEEMWNPSISNIIQVLVSIQALVMDNLVLQKEPGYEDYEESYWENKAYCAFVKYNNLKWAMVDMLKNPPVEFRKLVRLHFAIQKERILETIAKWLEEDYTDVILNDLSGLAISHNNDTYQIFYNSSYKAELTKVTDELKELLAALPSVEEIQNEEYQYEEPKDFPAGAVISDQEQNAVWEQKSDYNEEEPTKEVQSQPPPLPLILAQESENDPQAPESSCEYYQALKSHRFNTFDILNQSRFIHINELGPLEAVQSLASRYTKEMKVLSNYLPCDPSAAIFVAMDTNRMDVMKALISGVDDTPYAYGLYLFDILCPETYPNNAPLVKIATTGDGQVRFNPNLYADGYVCLSIIDTWEGRPEEMWNPQHSNIYQVLVSIQSLVMDSMIIQKEPNFEYVLADDAHSRAYVNIVRYNNVKHAMLEMIRNPPVEFGKITHYHFSHNKKAIIQVVDKWLEEAKLDTIDYQSLDHLIYSHNSPTVSKFSSDGYYNSLLAVVTELKEELEVLPTDQLILAELHPEQLPVSSNPVESEEVELPPVLMKHVSSSGLQPPESQSIYFKSLKELRFNSHNILNAPEEERRHSLIHEAGPATSIQSKSKRYAKEMKVLSRDLPCEATGSIFVAVDENQMNIMHALISGVSDTPYAHGLYLFDIACPENYPENPPKVKIATTGQGYVRFNPNLYADGYVCLSIINTWSGSPEEMWNPESSSILQVLLSIQVLVMDNEVIAKEPGYETYGKDSEPNQLYCNIVKYNNIKYAMIEMIKNPHPAFKNVIRNHFLLKEEEIIKTVDEWVKEISEKFTGEEVYDPDGLIDCHNSHTLSLFRDRNIVEIFKEAQAELVEAFRFLHNPELAQPSSQPEVAIEAPVDSQSEVAAILPLEPSQQEIEVQPQADLEYHDEAHEELPAILSLEPSQQDIEVQPPADHHSDLSEKSLEYHEEAQEEYQEEVEQECQETENLEAPPILLRAASSSDPVPPESETKYYSHLSPSKLNTHKILESSSHSLTSYLASVESMNSPRLSKEIAVLSKHLPCEAEGSVFVQVDEARMDLMRALISGPLDTPYAHGLYLFDIVCLENYPTLPPKMHITTTGGNLVRFNPNLYSDGYICLSIINTWSGNPEEMWSPGHSNILQVLLSIQSLVMDDEVIHKEPGYEGYDKNGADNLAYSYIVRYNNIKYAMIDMIRNPPSGFETIVQKHFAIKKKEINATLDKWLEEAASSTVDWNNICSLVLSHNEHTVGLFLANGYEKSMQEVTNELRELLASLEDF